MMGRGNIAPALIPRIGRTVKGTSMPPAGLANTGPPGCHRQTWEAGGLPDPARRVSTSPAEPGLCSGHAERLVLARRNPRQRTLAGLCDKLARAARPHTKASRAASPRLG